MTLLVNDDDYRGHSAGGDNNCGIDSGDESGGCDDDGSGYGWLALTMDVIAMMAVATVGWH